jgi:geranylgeranyl diphosphate synthase type II
VAAGGLDRSLIGLVRTTADRSDLVAGVEHRLRDVAKVVRRSMLDTMPDGEPSQWLYAPMREYPSRPGKALRPALCLSAGRVFGANADDLLGIAVAIELLHNAFLVHDDIADGSEMRRGRPTLTSTYGTAAALNAGDGLAVVAGQVLRRATRRFDRDLADLVWSEFDTMAMRTLEGQATEVGWLLDDVYDLRPEDYLHLIMHKTCWYTTIHPLRVGAIVGSGGTVDLAPLVRFGFHFGAAFQIRDDLLNLIGDERMYGKEILGDLYEGKRTLPLVHLLTNSQGDDLVLVRDYIRRTRAERSPELVCAIRELMDVYGSIAFTREYAEGILLVAEEYFDQAFADAQPGDDLDFLRALVPYVWARWR